MYSERISGGGFISIEAKISPRSTINNLLHSLCYCREGSVVKISGSGVVVAKDGFILTNAHVVDRSKKITITLSSGRVYKANLVAVDELTDLAVIKAEVSADELIPAPMGNSQSLQSGDWVIAVGCPAGLDFTVTLGEFLLLPYLACVILGTIFIHFHHFSHFWKCECTGIVSNPKRSAFEVGAPHMKGSYIQTDAALNQGNSGGASSLFFLQLGNSRHKTMNILLYLKQL